MPNRSLTLLTLGVLFLIAIAITCSLPGDVVARSAFQSSVLESPLAEVSSTPTVTPTRAIVASPIPLIATPVPRVSPTVVPTRIVPTPTAIPTETPAQIGYLPPPTITAPGAFAGGNIPGGLSSFASGASAAPAGQTDPFPTRPEPSVSPAAQFIDSAILALSYTWLCGGVLILAAAAVAIALLVRRSQIQ